ncbi:MAG: transglutaminase-like domain-containing protein [Micrococcales bacterium]|nr:transglutaminase-like domain-containing protein [Micrococcales bacterium]
MARAGTTPRGGAVRPSRAGRARATSAGVVYVLLAVALATAMVWPVFQTERLLLVAGVGAGLGVLLGLVASRARWSGWWTALAAFGLYVVVSVPVAVPYRMTSLDGIVRGSGEAVAEVVLGWRRLLTLRLPVEDYQASLAPWLAATIAVSLLGTMLAVRTDRRSPWAVPVVGVLPLLAGLLTPVTPGAAWAWGPFTLPDARTTVPGAVFVMVTVAWLVGRARLRRSLALAMATSAAGGSRRARRFSLAALGPATAGFVLVGVAVMAAVAVTPLVSSAADRRTVRENVEPMLAVQAASSPLDGFRAAFSGDAAATEMFTVTVTGEPVDRLRIAVLDAYDGQHFSTSTSGADRTFVRLPRVSTAGAASRTTVTMGEAASGVWMPVPDGLVAAPVFSGPRADQLAAAFYVSPWGSSAINVATTGVGQPGLRPGDRYVVASSPVSPGTLGRPAEVSLLDTKAYPELVAWVKAQGQPRTGEGLVALVDRLRARGYLSHWVDSADASVWLEGQTSSFTVVPAYAGHSTSRVEDLFLQLNNQQDAVGVAASDADLVAAVGDAEQFATAVALLARYLGYESRVVMGVRLDSGDPSLPVCDRVCTGSHLAAWVEVRSTGGAWVAMDADPQRTNLPRPVTQGQEPPQNPTQVQQPDLEVVQPPDAAQDSTARATATDTGDQGRQVWWLGVLRTVGLTLGVLLLSLMPLLTIPMVKALRRWRRARAPVPEVAAVGAWAELSDRCLDLGVPLTGPTRRVAATASERPGATALAVLVDEAVFGSAPAGAGIRAEAWDLIEQDLAQLHTEVSPWGRFVAWVRPRSIVRALPLPPAGRPGRRASMSTRESG